MLFRKNAVIPKRLWRKFPVQTPETMILVLIAIGTITRVIFAKRDGERIWVMADDFEELYSKLSDKPEITRNGSIRKPLVCRKCGEEIKWNREKVTSCDRDGIDPVFYRHGKCTEHVNLICGCPKSKNRIMHISTGPLIDV